MLVRQFIQTNLYVVFIFQTVFQYIKLQDADDANDDFFHTGIQLLENLDSTFLCNLVDTFDKLFSLHGIHLGNSGKMLRCESWNSLVSKFFARSAQRISDGENAWVEHTDNVTGICLIDNMAGFCHHLLRLGEAHFAVALHVINLFGGIKFTGADTHEGDSVAMRLVHICLNLKDEGREILAHWINLSTVCLAGQGRSCHLEEMFQECLHTKVGECRTKEDWRKLSFADQFLIKLSAGTVQKFNFFKKSIALFFAYYIQQMLIVDVDCLLDTFFRTLLGIGEGQYLLRISVVNTAELLTGTNWPVYRAGRNAELFFNLIEQIKGIVGIAVHFIDKSKNRNVAHNTYFKQFACLCLDTFGAVNDHNRGICCHQGTIRIL